MTDSTHETVDDPGLFAALRRMWQARDPMPVGLVDDVLVTLATRELADDYALLLLIDDSTELVGARSPGGVRVLEFNEGATTVMLRVSEVDAGRVRLDGWLVPAGTGTVHLEQDAADESAPVSGEGRFEFASVARGSSRLRLVPEQVSPASGGFSTELFDL
jgi:hypothetical protein